MIPTAATLLRDTRQAAGLTQASLAQRAQTSQPAVAAYESGSRTPTLSTLERLLAACGRELVLDSQATASARSMQALIHGRRTRLLAAARRHGARNVRIFGSVARGGESAESDVDLIVDLDVGRTLVDLAALREDAASILGVPVDVVTSDLLKEHVRDEVLRDAVPL
jgi:predicted nucleotidyltransferase/DNA-binding XRE family transcriptional regulator